MSLRKRPANGVTLADINLSPYGVHECGHTIRKTQTEQFSLTIPECKYAEVKKRNDLLVLPRRIV